MSSLASASPAVPSSHPVLPPQRPQPTPPLSSLSDMAVEQHSPSCTVEEEIKQLDKEYTEIERLFLRTIKLRDNFHETMLGWLQVPPFNIKSQFSECLQENEEALRNVSNVDQLHKILSPYWDPLHPTLLEYLIEELADDVLNTKIKCYMERLCNFRHHTTLGSFIDEWMRGPPPGFKEYIIEVGEEWRNKTLEEFNRFIVGLSRQKCIGRHIAYITKVTTCCIAVVIALPQCCFPLKPDDELLHYLRENTVQRISTVDECILNLEANKSDNETSETSDKVHMESIKDISEKDQKMMLVDVIVDNASQQKMEKKVMKESMRGIEVYGETCIVVTNSAQSFEWEGYGLKLHFQESSLPKDIKQITIIIKASTAGHYVLPENSNLVSAVYWFYCEPKCKLEKQATLELEHCAKSENISKLSFIGASSSQGKLPYTFSRIEGGQFSGGSSYGVLDLHKFCGKAIGQDGSDEKEYRASVLYLKHEHERHICFIVTLNLSVHLTAIEDKYNTKADTEISIYFESNKITLDIPREGIDLPSGWKIIPLSHPVITKKEVDKFEPKTKGIPHCKLLALLEDPSKRKPLLYTVNLQGAKDPPNFFTVHIENKFSMTATSIPQASASASIMSPQTVISQSTVPQLRDLMKELRQTVADKWEDIGIMLGIPDSNLRQIKADHPSDSSSCTREMLRFYLSQVTPPPSWEAVAEALESLGLSNVAEHIKFTYLKSV